MATTRPRKPVERAEARRLRKQGAPLKRIASELGVSPSSVLTWTRDIELTEEQHEQNLRGPTGPLYEERIRKRAKAWSARCRSRRADFQAEGRARAREGDPLHYAGCMLYWAEGAKGRNTVNFVNSDPYMLRLFLRFLIKTLGVDRERIRIRLNVRRF
jgi:hypothetical protein